MKELITPLTAPHHPTVGHVFKSCGERFYCDSYDPRIGFWMASLDTDARRNVSERAIGRTFHEDYNFVRPLAGQVYELDEQRVWLEEIKYYWRYDKLPAGGASVIGSYKERRYQRGQWPLVDFIRRARLLHDPRHDVHPHPVRVLTDAMAILRQRHPEAQYYLSLQLRASYTSEEIKLTQGGRFDNLDPAAVGCQCAGVKMAAELEPGAGCLCGPDELILRAYANAAPGLPPLTLAQRASIIADAVHDAEGGLSDAELEAMTDQDLAQAAIQAMWDYVRSNCL